MLGSTIDTTNTQYSAFSKIWQKMRDVFQGEEHMKDRTLVQNSGNLDGRDTLSAIKTFDQYLRPTDSMRRLGDLGYQRFCDYIYRAKFYPFPQEIKSQSLGLIENQPASIELPTQMKGMIKDATCNNEPMGKLLSIIYGQQLEVSRVGLLLSPSNELGKPFNIATYSAESILDWVEDTNENQEKVLVWVKIKTDEVDKNDNPIYLVLALDEQSMYFQYKTTNETVSYGDEFSLMEGYMPDSYAEPMAAESRIDQIPFVIINVSGLGGDVDRPFLESVADAAISLFRASAHYEDALYWGGESTLFHKGYALGSDEKVYVGNGATNKSNLEYADAKYVTMGTNGIGPREKNVEKQYEYNISLGVDLINNGTESGAALNIRSNVKTASLKTLSLTGADGLQRILTIGAHWIGANTEQVLVVANTTFADAIYTAEDFVKFSTMVKARAMREIDMYTLQKRNNITTADTFEEWQGGMVDYEYPDATLDNEEQID